MKSLSREDIDLRKLFEVNLPGSIQSCNSIIKIGNFSIQSVFLEKSSDSYPSISILIIKG
jgi:hypothetical protein